MSTGDAVLRNVMRSGRCPVETDNRHFDALLILEGKRLFLRENSGAANLPDGNRPEWEGPSDER